MSIRVAAVGGRMYLVCRVLEAAEKKRALRGIFYSLGNTLLYYEYYHTRYMLL